MSNKTKMTRSILELRKLYDDLDYCVDFKNLEATRQVLLSHGVDMSVAEIKQWWTKWLTEELDAVWVVTRLSELN